MKSEIEVKFLGVDIEDVRKKLESIGAVLVSSMQTLKRHNLDNPQKMLATKNGWLRIRKGRESTTLTYKQLDNWKVDGVKEVEVNISDYDNALELLSQLGYIPTSFQESNREVWLVGSTELVIDQWPWTRPYIEIEGESEQALRQLANKLGFHWSDACFGSVEVVYVSEYDITPEQFLTIDKIDFNMPVPNLLVVNKRETPINPMAILK